MVLTLYNMESSPPARSVSSVIELLGIRDVKYKELSLRAKDHLKDDYLKINPQHTIPTLIDDGFVIIDSHAIITYLVSKYAKNDTLYPKDLQKRATVDHRLHFDSNKLFPTLRAAIFPVIFKGEKSFDLAAVEELKNLYDIVEKYLTNTWIAGDNLTLADISCGTTLISSDVILPINKATHSKLYNWLKRLNEQPFFKKANEVGSAEFKEAVLVDTD